MDQLKRIIAAFTLRQKLLILVAAVAVAASLVFGVRWNHDRDLRPLFTNLAAEDAGALVEKLRAANVDYRVGDNGTILVPSSRVAELRLEMAAAGLPRTGRIGFELFDKTNLGTTEFAEQINFRRALEGELERSILSLAEVERARVHVTFSKESVFLENRQPAKASVLVKIKIGQKLSTPNVMAIQHLTASAVEGLQPEFVSVLDMMGNLLSRPRRDAEADAGATSAMLEYRQVVERDYLTKIRETLDPLLGPDKYRAGVSIECDFTSGEQSEETFDPNRSVMLSSQRTEDVSASGVTGGVPGTASSLPRPVPRAGSSGGGVSRKTENTAYQTSRMVRRMKLPQGAVKRLSVSVLVDQAVRWEGSGPKARRLLEPPPAEKLKVVRDVVAGSVGLQAERGDQILVETLPFEATLSIPPPEELRKPGPTPAAPGGFAVPAFLAPLLQKAPLPVWIGAGAALLVVFLVVVFVLIRRIRKHRGAKAKASVDAAAAIEGGAAKKPLVEGASGDGFEEQAMAMLAENQAQRDQMEREVIASMRLPPHTKKSEVLKKVITEQTKANPAAIAQLMRTWISDKQS
jgi:flagellar M-ring protein FliF